MTKKFFLAITALFLGACAAPQFDVNQPEACQVDDADVAHNVAAADSMSPRQADQICVTPDAKPKDFNNKTWGFENIS